MGAERRRFARIAVDIDVEISVQINKKGNAKVINISKSDLFVESNLHVNVGNLIVIKLPGQEIMIGANVRRVTETGFGAEFGRMSDKHREALSACHTETERTEISSVAPLPTVMLVSDPPMLSSLASELKLAGFAVLETKNAAKVLSLLSRFKVVGIISEYLVGGKSMMPILREVKTENNIPIILYSSRYDVPQREFAEKGIDCFFKYNTCTKCAVFFLKESISAV